VGSVPLIDDIDSALVPIKTSQQDSYRPDGKAGANIGKALTDFNSLPTVAVRADELIEFDDANNWLWRTAASA
jgi:hypothetical protein